MNAYLNLSHKKSLLIAIFLLFSNLIYSNNLDKVVDTICTKDKLYTYENKHMTTNRYKLASCLINQIPRDSFNIFFQDRNRLSVMFIVDLCGYPIKLNYFKFINKNDSVIFSNKDSVQFNSIESYLLNCDLKYKVFVQDGYILTQNQKKESIQRFPDTMWVHILVSLPIMDRAILRDFGIEIEDEANKMQCEPYDVYKTYINKWIDDNYMEFYDAKH